MSKRVYEIAKELEMESRELLEKINGMGIVAKGHNSVISEIDVKAITNMILHSRTKKTETKIVKAPTKIQSSPKEQEVKISVKAAPVTRKTREKPIAKPARPKTTPKTPPRKAPEADSEQVKAKPISKQPPIGVPLPKSASKQPPVGIPLPKSESLQHHETQIKDKGESQKQDKGEKVIEEKQEIEKKKEEAIKEEATIDLNLPKGLVIKKRAADIAKEKAAKEKADQEKAAEEKAAREKEAAKERAAKEKAAKEKAAKEKAAKEKADRLAKRKVERAKVDKLATEKPKRPTADGAERPAQDSKRKPAKDKSARPEKERATAVASKGDRTTRDKADRPTKERPAKEKFERVAKDKGEPAQAKRQKGRKDYRRGDIMATPMKKQAPKKYKKKVEKPVETTSNIDLETLEPGSKIINVPITVKGLSEQIEKSTSEIILALMKLGIMANVNQNLDEDTAILLGAELGINIVIDKVEEEIEEEGLETFEDEDVDLKNRPPIITVMGHVDHGKTSLLDAIRKTNVTTTESGGITQHIGASEVRINGQRIVFLDTPGHEAFTAMRARGAHVTDIAVLVVAADDSVKPQTIESISHAKAAGIPIIVAINKVDKPEANPDRVKQDLANLPPDQRVLVEEYGGDTISVPVSAKTGEGIQNLLEMILLQAEVMELKANPGRLAMGTVVEARLDKSKGPVATLLVLNGTMQTGMPIVVGTCCGKVRAMTNYKGDNIRKAGPATAVEILGLNDVPEAGDEFNAVKEDKIAREIAEQRRLKVREEVMFRNSSTTLDQLFSQIKEGEIKELNLIIKADVQGSVGALISSLEKLHTENVKVRIIHSGVGTVTESDIMLATTSDAIIIAFNVRPSSNISAMAEHENVEIRTYRVIYDVIDDIEAAMKGLLEPVYKELILGKIEIRNTFKVPGVGIVGGAYVLEGKVQRNAGVRLVRDGIVLHEGKISSLKRFKDDAREVSQGYECGVGIENYNDIKEGDIIEAFKMEEIER